MNTASQRDFLKSTDARVLEANTPSSDHLVVGKERPLRLDSDRMLSPYRIAYKTYGTLNAAKSNAILVCHALTGDQYVASPHPVTGKPGWWETMVGPGKPIDTDRFFVICPNVLGGCMGSTGPASDQPRHRQALGLDFPVITIGDMVDAQVRADRSSRHRPAVLRRRRLDGRHAGAGVGRAPRATACSRPCRSPPRRGIPRRTSPSTRSAGRR